MNELNIQNGKGITIITKYANFKKEYAEMEHQTRLFVRDNLDKVKFAKDEEDRIVQSIEFKANVYPPANYLNETKGLIGSFLISRGNVNIGMKSIDLARIFYLSELLKLEGIVDNSKDILDIIDYIFAHGNFKYENNTFTYAKLNDEVADALNVYETLYVRFKEVADNVSENQEIEDTLVSALMKLGIIRLIVDPKSFDPEEVDLDDNN